MLQVTPAATTVARLCRELGFTLDDDRAACELDRDEVAAVLDRLRQGTKPVDPKLLGAIGPAAYGRRCSYACHAGIVRVRGAEILYVVEAWAQYDRPEKRGDGSATLRLLLSRTPSAATILAPSVSAGLVVRGCGLARGVLGPHTADYRITVGVISPYIELATDGKEPALAPYSEAIATVLRKACRAAYRAMGKPPGNALLSQARIAERFDIAIMSTKGMSTTAARLLLDRLAPRIDKVLVAHDFDVSGFSIFGTLGSDGRRYLFHNEVHIVDIGLRLSDVEAMGLDSEPVETSGDWSARSATLSAHGASVTEIKFLRHRRVELNAMPADMFVRFLERKTGRAWRRQGCSGQ